ncbi:cytochrome-c peroxidase [Ideonella alba]|uniref:Cytochrome B6 n=1 Tax=Ideonella alba TaxID=2824118 RepID=A0A941B9T0_9BURK|nr:cytochrome c peroxidase [Ideonella alba]MBQ0929070.1 cytochrome B6 [Ideonella alba]
MPFRPTLIAALVLLCIGLCIGWILGGEEREAPPMPPPGPTPALPFQALQPLPPVPALPAERVALGERLFHETRLSHDNSLSCASCHDLAHGGADARPVSLGVRGQPGQRNAPTVFNASLNFVQFWDGRAGSLREQAAGPVHNPVEMASSWPEVLDKLRADASYREAFASAYGGPPTAEHIVDALASFEETLLTPDSPLDRFLRGEPGALDARQRAGLQRFIELGCVSCHQGVGIGGNMFQRFGVMEAPPPAVARDSGRQAVTGREADRGVFKVPGLRNVALTAPYFHDASAATLEDAVRTMARVQLGQDMAAQDVDLIVAFLHALTGRWQGQALQ